MAFGIPVSPLLAVAADVGKPQVEQVVRASQSAWRDMLDIGALASQGIEAKRPTTDQAAAHPAGALPCEGRVGLGDLIHQRYFHIRDLALARVASTRSYAGRYTGPIAC